MGIRLPKFGWFRARPKTAWCCRWVLGSVAVLALAAWVFTLWWRLCWVVPNVSVVYVTKGALYANTDPTFKLFGVPTSLSKMFGPGLHLGESYPKDGWFDDENPSLLARALAHFPRPSAAYQRNQDLNVPHVEVGVPLWLLAALAAPPALAAWRNRWFVKRLGRCIKCGYSRTGLAEAAVCPECGEAPRP